MLEASRIDTSTLPKEYLQSYPYPAFVLLVPISIPVSQAADSDGFTTFNGNPQPAQFTAARQDAIQPFEVVWANDKWMNLTQKKPLLECIDVSAARELGRWIVGVKEGSSKQILEGPKAAGVDIPTGPSICHETPQFYAPCQILSTKVSKASLELSTDQSQPPRDFWAAEHPYDDRSVSFDLSSHAGAESTGIEDGHGLHLGLRTVTVELINPGKITLEMTKTIMPVFRKTAGGLKNEMNTHSFAVVTTTPKSYFVPNHPAQATSPTESIGLAIKETSIDLVPNPKMTAPALLETAKATVISPMKMPTSFGPLSSKSTATDCKGSRDKGVNSISVESLMETTDWTKTSLGHREKWPQSLKTIVGLVLNYPHQCCLWWGKELTLIYNEPYAREIHKHPYIFGMSGAVAWSEIWSALGPLSELVLGGTPVYKEDDLLLFKQLPHQGDGVIEEYHTWMWVPVLQENGSFGGLWNATIRTTKKVLAERRMATVREMGQRTSIARTMTEFNEAVIDILRANPKDAPFAALYHVEPSSASKGKAQGPSNAEATKSDPIEVPVDVTLVGSIGIPEHHPSTPESISFSLHHRCRSSVTRFSQGINSSPALSMISSLSNPVTSYLVLPGATPGEDGRNSPALGQWTIREALHCRRLIMLEDISELIKDYPIRTWDELPNAAVVVPINSDNDENIPSAVLVLGLNIRRPFDEDYESFINMLKLQLASGIAAVRSYEAEKQRLDELDALDRAKAGATLHLCSTPLTLIAGPIDDLILETKDGHKKEILLIARRNLRRLSRLVSTLMDVSRLEAGRLKGTFRLVNLGIMTGDLAALFKTAFEKAKLRYSIEVDSSPENIFVDPEHWEKIVFNLIGNSMKYTMAGYVEVTLHYVNNQAVLTVEDSGVGIPRNTNNFSLGSDIYLIGERFHRVPSVSRSHEGTGIGLALTKELINLHGGTLEIESTIAEESEDGSHGSIFRVKIPIGYDHLPFDDIDHGQMLNLPKSVYGQHLVDEAMQWVRDREGSSVVSSEESSSSITADSGPSNRAIDPNTLYFQKDDVIMLVEDSADTRRYMKSIFSQYCQIVEACDGQEALDLCSKRLPDLIISDIMMPKLDGFELLAALKKTNELKVVPVIMLTAKGADESKVSGIMAGADDYLAKPFNAREIVARAHMQLQLGKKRRHLEEAFEERTAELTALATYTPVGIFRSDSKGKITFANRSWYKMSGYPMNEPVGNWVEAIIAPEEQDAIVKFWENVLTGTAVSQSSDWRYKNGKWSKLLFRLAKSTQGLLGCITDITERKLHEESQLRQVAEAEQRRLHAEEAKRQQELLIDVTSHEIRNPISSPLHCSSLVKTNLLSLQEQLHLAIENRTPFVPTHQLMNNINEDLEALESIYQCGLTQERISNDVLSLGRIQLDMLQMFDVEFDIKKEAHNILSVFQNEARMKRITLSFTAGESHDILGLKSLKTDLVRLNQITTNLLSNAIRFTSTSPIRRINIRSEISFNPPKEGQTFMSQKPVPPKELKDDMVVYLFLEVADTGPGLSPDEVQKLFHRFSQVSPKTHTIFGGSGLGLFVCRKLSELMGGGIDVVSEKGKGSIFRFYVKAKTCRTSKTSAKDLHSLTKVQHNYPARYFGMTRKPHVLIVEDNLINQTVLARQLKHCNLTCDVASDGLEALEKIRKASSIGVDSDGQSFDCVLMDLEMPVMDGLTAVKHIREEEGTGKLKKNLVIALTGNARQGQIDQARASGMDEVIIKPYRLDDLLQKIELMMKVRVDEENAVINKED
nr:hypothetical protein L203_01154 [Cryptococcus depauperatus CBS 7841]